MHVVLRSSRARGSWSLLDSGKRKVVDRAIAAATTRFSVRVYDRANVGNHLHFVLKARTRDAYLAFIRYLSGRIAFEVTSAKKGRAAGRFWDSIPYSRVLEWGRDFINARVYVTKNLFEGEGVELMTPYGVKAFQIRDGTLRSGYGVYDGTADASNCDCGAGGGALRTTKKKNTTAFKLPFSSN